MQSAIIPQKDYNSFCKANSQINCRRGLRFTDGTMRVILEDIVGPEEELTEEERIKKAQEEWETERQMFLRTAHTNATMAAEGSSLGYLPEGDCEEFLWGQTLQYAEMDDDYLDYESYYRPMPNHRTINVRLAKNIRGWENQFWDSEVSIDTILRKLSSTGIIYRTKNLTQEDQWDYAGHAFGLYNTGCVQIEDKRLVFNGVKTANYIEEHFIRRIMSEDVSLEFLRKLGYCKKKDYATLDKDERSDLVRKLLEKAKIVEREIDAKQQEAIQQTNDLVKTHFPKVLAAFPDFKVVFR